MKKKILLISGILGFLIIILVVIYILLVKVSPPEITPHTPVVITKIASEHMQASNGSWLRKNDKAMWEMYLTGNPHELGSAFGQMAITLNAEKEAAFIGEIERRIPSPSYLNFLKYLVGWFNRDLDAHIPQPYLQEVYGSSAYMADAYDFIAPKYHRALSYHGAHDIGHALQNMDLVGCTSFATWDSKSEDGKLIIGRNFDFYFGEEFAKDQIIAFYNPDDGYQFMSITWACFSGVVSGMNEKGLTVTLNAAKSEIPSKGKTPVSFIAREILQHAANIDEAYAVAQKFESFVAETFLIGSKADGKAGLIEKTPLKTTLYLQENDALIATNHFQSEALKNDPINQEYVAEGVSTYRYDRIAELRDSIGPLNPEKSAYILRDKLGKGGKYLGLSNEKTSNQLLAHHSVIFSPDDMMVWVSSPPYQLGDFLAYDLGEIFGSPGAAFTYNAEKSIAPDPFLFTPEFAAYKEWVQIRDKILDRIYSGRGELTENEIRTFTQANPNGFLTYYYLGDYFMERKEWSKAAMYYKAGLNTDIAKESERRHMEEGLAESESKLKS